MPGAESNPRRCCNKKRKWYKLNKVSDVSMAKISPRRLAIPICIVLAIVYVSDPQHQTIFNQFYYYMKPEAGIQCYRSKDNTLPDISDYEPTKGRSIFFHETSCNSHLGGKIFINARQACAVESAARSNPNFEVHLLFASPGTLRLEGSDSDRLLQALLSYENIKLHHVDYERYTKSTPVEDLYKNGHLEVSGYAQSHASDVLRYLTLWKYGGIYLDLDVVVVKSLEELQANYAGAESERNVAAGVISFSPDDLGHSFAQSCLDDLRNNFKGYDWGYNGPGVITRLLRKTCKTQLAKDMVHCDGFTVYPIETFYAVPWLKWKMFFDEDFTDSVVNMTRNSYVIHVWNKHSTHTKIPVRGRTAYAVFAQKYCPRVVEQCGYFL